MHSSSLAWQRLLVILSLIPSCLLAQSTATGTCWRGNDTCHFIILTEFGGYSDGITTDLGTLVNLSSKDALGLSLHFSALGDAFQPSFGPMLRYRRWIGHQESLDFGLGLPILKDPSFAPSVYGLVKWNPTYWFGLSLRPEIRREPGKQKFRMSAGVEVDSKPGVVVTLIVGALVGIWAASY